MKRRNPFIQRIIQRDRVAKIFNACPSISNSPPFFPASITFFLYFFFFSHAEKQPPVFLRRPIFGCANTVHCRGARALTSISPPLSLSLPKWITRAIPFSLSLSFSNHPVQKLTLDPPRSDLNMQNDFFLRHRGSFPCLVHRAHIITGWQENNGQKTIDEKRSGEQEKKKLEEKKRRYRN